MKTASQSAVRTVLVAIGVGALLPLAAFSAPGCKKDEPPPPLPSAAPAPTPAAPVELAPEDAGADVFDAGEDASDAAVKKVGTGGGGGLARCCAALQQNAASAPPPTNTYMLQAAAVCNAAVAAGKDKNSVVGALSGAVRGAGLPAACR
ncbi:MAG TPA: acyltransferase [Polyangiaceae bacterium]|nr:acyltransferase [Polyangiaceae bacterium]